MKSLKARGLRREAQKALTVRDLIAALRKMKQNSEVYVDGYSGLAAGVLEYGDHVLIVDEVPRPLIADDGEELHICAQSPEAHRISDHARTLARKRRKK